MLKQNELIKGFYNLFGSSGIKDSISSFDKEGSQVKSGIGNVLTNINKQKSDVLEKMEECLEGLEFSPEELCDQFSEYNYLIDFTPKKFNYGVIYNGKQGVDESKGIEQQVVNKPTTEQACKMRLYNDLVYQYMDMCVSKIKLEAMRRSLQDNKTYTLTIDQVSLLGL
jgi:hypothetical protein